MTNTELATEITPETEIVVIQDTVEIDRLAVLREGMAKAKVITDSLALAVERMRSIQLKEERARSVIH